MSRPLHEGVPAPGSVLPRRDKPALGHDAGQAFTLRGYRLRSESRARPPGEDPSSLTAEAIRDDQAGGFWQLRK